MEQNKPYLRHQRVSDLIEEELSKIILREVEFHPGVLLSITELSASKKLDQAKILVSVIPSTETEGAVKLLNKRAPYLAHKLLRKLNIRPLPQLNFIVDEGSEHASKIEKTLLDEEAKNS